MIWKQGKYRKSKMDSTLKDRAKFDNSTSITL
jgi:hypothetical protein